MSLSASWTFPCQEVSVPQARRLLRATLLGWGLTRASELAELLVSELVTNAVRHGAGPVRLYLSASDGMVRCEVEDGVRLPPRLRHPDAVDEGGRGLALVDGLSSGWGSVPTRRGKIVWFELSTADAGDGVGVPVWPCPAMPG